MQIDNLNKKALGQGVALVSLVAMLGYLGMSGSEVGDDRYRQGSGSSTSPMSDVAGASSVLSPDTKFVRERVDVEVKKDPPRQVDAQFEGLDAVGAEVMGLYKKIHLNKVRLLNKKIEQELGELEFSGVNAAPSYPVPVDLMSLQPSPDVMPYDGQSYQEPTFNPPSYDRVSVNEPQEGSGKSKLTEGQLEVLFSELSVSSLLTSGGKVSAWINVAGSTARASVGALLGNFLVKEITGSYVLVEHLASGSLKYLPAPGASAVSDLQTSTGSGFAVDDGPDVVEVEGGSGIPIDVPADMLR